MNSLGDSDHPATTTSKGQGEYARLVTFRRCNFVATGGVTVGLKGILRKVNVAGWEQR